MSANRFTEAPRSRPLNDVADIVSGYGFPKELQGKSNGDLPFFKVGDISAAWNSGQKKLTQAQHHLDYAEASSIRAKTFPQGTVVFAKIGEAIKLNRRAILGQPSIVDNNVMGLIPKDGIVDPNYLFYWSLMLRLGDISQATTVPSVRKSDVEQLSFPWIPLDQQKRIVAEIEKQFSRLDEAVANLKRVKANLKRYKAAVLKAAVEGRLVETEAERARREGRSYETGAQLLQRILETRRSQWQGKGKYKEPAAPDTTDLPELPEGWVWGTFGHLCQIQGGYAFRSSNYQPHGVPLVRISNLVNGTVQIKEDTVFLPKEFLDEFAGFLLQKGDTLIAMSGATTGKMATFSLDSPALLNQRVGRFKPTVLSLIVPDYISLLAMQASGKVLADAYGAAQPNISPTEIEAMPVGVPPLAEQHRIVSEVDRRLSLLREIEGQVVANLQRAERLRQSVLRKAFSENSHPLSYIGANRYGK